MTAQSKPRHEARLLFACWIFLLALTAGSFWIAEVNLSADSAIAGVVLGIAALKAHLIAGVFMEMLQAPRIWAIALSAFLLALTGLLVALFLF